MMGSGKSTIGRALAGASDRSFFDTDKELEHLLGARVSEIFRTYGEDAFRDHESAILQRLERSPLVIATGGGIVLRDENWEQFKRLGRSLYFRCSAESLCKRLARSKSRRPLLDREDWEEHLGALLKQRSHIYERADYIIDVDGREIEDVVEQARKLLETR